MLRPDPTEVRSPSDEGGDPKSILSAPTGTVVGVQTACYVVEASRDQLRQTKSLMIAAQSKALDDAYGRGGAAGAAELAYCGGVNTEAIHAVMPGSGAFSPHSPTGLGGTLRRQGINPELFFPFQCLLRNPPDTDAAEDRDFIRQMQEARSGHEALDSHSPADYDQLVSNESLVSADISRHFQPLLESSAAEEEPPVVEPALKEECMLEVLAGNAMAGVNNSVLSVGGSGTGKADKLLHPADGLAPRFMRKVFEAIDAAKKADAESFKSVNRTVSISIYECFAEEFADLLTIPQKADKKDTTVAELAAAITGEGPSPAAQSPAQQNVQPPKAATRTSTSDGNKLQPPSDGGFAFTMTESSGTSPAHGPTPAARSASHLTVEGTDAFRANAKRNVSFSTDLISTVAEGPMFSPDPLVAEDDEKPLRFDPGVLRTYTQGQGMTPANTGLRMRQHPELGAVVEGAQELQVLSFRDFLQVARGAIARRCSSGVKTNRYSHLVMRVTLRQVEVGAAAALTSVTTFVDTGTALRVPSSIPKAKQVQKSMNALKRMIQTLSEHCAGAPASQKVDPSVLGKPTREDEHAVKLITDVMFERNVVPSTQPRHPSSAAVPNAKETAIALLAKDSVLTQLIADAFLGNSYTVLLGHVLDPATIGSVGCSAMEEEGAQQTLVTLKLVARASAIATRVLQNFRPVQAAAGAIRDEIATLKKQLEDEASQGANASEEKKAELNARLQSYEDQLGNIQAAFDEKVTTKAELEAACMRQRRALEDVQRQLESRRQQAEELDAFAAQIDELMEEHRANEARIRREREQLREREAEAERLRRRVSVMAREQEAHDQEMRHLQQEEIAARQRNIAAFFKGLLEQEQKKRDIAAYSNVNKQLRTRCALQQAKLDKAKRAQKALEDEIEQQRAVHAALVAKQKTLEEDQSVEIADRTIAETVEVTQRLVAKLEYTRVDLKKAEAETEAAKSAFAEEHGAAAEQVKHLAAAVSDGLNEASALELKLTQLSAAKVDADEQVLRLQKREKAAAEDVTRLEAELDAMDAARRRDSEESARSRAERDSTQEAVAAITLELEALRGDIEAWEAQRAQAKAVYSDLCSSASRRLSTTAPAVV